MKLTAPDYIKIGAIAVSIIVGYTTLQAKAKETESKVNKVERRVEKLTSDVSTLDKASNGQEIRMQNVYEQTTRTDNNVQQIQTDMKEMLKMMMEK